MQVIYDIGSNNGDDITYYLKKAELVVAVEADPKLTARICERFASEIQAGRLVVENYVLTSTDVAGDVPFYLHKGHHVLSQLARPSETELHQFEEVRLPTKRITDIIDAHGMPYYIKIDLEGLDAAILRELFDHHVFPPYLSAEAHSIEVFQVLAASGAYKAFKILEGETVGTIYVDHDVMTEAGLVHHHFSVHSAGPFGNDIFGPWESAATFAETLSRVGLGWRDIHVSRFDQAEI